MKGSGVVNTNQPEEVDKPTTVITEKGVEQIEQIEQIEDKEDKEKEMKEERNKSKKETKPGKLHITQLMVICFIYEFCVRFAQGGYNSRYGIYVTRKFGITSDIFAYVVSYTT